MSNILFLDYTQLEFELTGVTGTTPGGKEKREWKSKHCNYKFEQSKNTNSDSWYTGLWKKKLESIASGKPKQVKGCIRAIARAKYILDKRWGSGPNKSGGGPVKGMAFFSFEENLIYQIHEGIAIISTGSTLSFFDNPFVRNWLHAMCPRHRVVYRSKLAKVIRCVNDVMQEEVSQVLSFTMLC